MGLFKGARDAMAAAGQAAGQAVGGLGGAFSAPDPGYVQMVNKIGKSGVQAPGTLKAMRVTGSPDMSGASMHEFDVSITPAGQAAYDTTIHQSMLPQQLTTLKEGAAVTVKYDPDNPINALLYGW